MNTEPSPDMDVETLREEVAFWRRDCIARLHFATALYQGALAKGQTEQAAHFSVGQLQPALAAWRAAESSDFHPSCEGCGKPLLPGQLYQPFEDIDGVHADCDDPAAAQPAEGLFTWEATFGPGEAERIVAEARKVHGDDA